MFTTHQRVARSPLPMTPRTDGKNTGDVTRHVPGKGKAVAFVDGPPPPPLGVLNEYGGNAAAEGGGLDDWRRFKEVGLLDEATMEWKDHQALVEKIDGLEKELFDYQYNMGLLLIENKELAASNEKLGDIVAETQEVVKREEAAHLMALSEVERRADNLRRALDFEKRCRADLEKAFHELDEENQQIRLRSQTNLVDANTLVAGIGDKSRAVEEKMHEADARLAEVNIKSLELDRRVQELETRERELQIEHQSFTAMREGWEGTFFKQKEDLQEWERKLQEGEERLRDGHRIIKSREEKVAETEMSFEQKEKELEEANKKVELNILASKKKEEDVNNRFLSLIAKEEQAESINKSLEIKEKELLDLAEKLAAKERVEIQKLLDAHKAALASKQREFDLEIKEKRIAIEADMRSKVEAIEQKEAEINQKEEKLKELEQDLETKSERLNGKEKDLDTALRENKKSREAEAEKLEMEKKQLLADKESLQILKVNTEKLKNEITQTELQIQEQIRKLKVTEDERAEFSRSQLELKEEIEKCRLQKDDLRKDRAKFEGEWAALDEKKSLIAKESTELGKQKEEFENHRQSEYEKLEREKHELTLNDFEQRKRDLEAGIQSKQMEMEEKEKVIRKDMEEVKSEQRRIAMEKNELCRDINELRVLRKKINDQNEEFNQERNRLLEFVERVKICGNCEEVAAKNLKSSRGLVSWLKKGTTPFKLSPHQEQSEPEPEPEDDKILETPRPGTVISVVERVEHSSEPAGDDGAHRELPESKPEPEPEDDKKETSRPGTVISIVERVEHPSEPGGSGGDDGAHRELPESEPESKPEPKPEDDKILETPRPGTVISVVERVEHSRTVISVVERVEHSSEPGGSGGDDGAQNGPSGVANDHGLPVPEEPEPEPGTVIGVVGNVEHSSEPGGSGGDDCGQKGPPEAANDHSLSDDESYRVSKTLEAAEGSQQSETRSRTPKSLKNRKLGARKTPTVQTVAEDMSVEVSEESTRSGATTRKRAHVETSLVSGSEVDGGDNEAQLESVTGGRRKRRQKFAPAGQTPRESRYNLRNKK